MSLGKWVREPLSLSFFFFLFFNPLPAKHIYLHVQYILTPYSHDIALVIYIYTTKVSMYRTTVVHTPHVWIAEQRTQECEWKGSTNWTRMWLWEIEWFRDKRSIRCYLVTCNEAMVLKNRRTGAPEKTSVWYLCLISSFDLPHAYSRNPDWFFHLHHGSHHRPTSWKMPIKKLIYSLNGTVLCLRLDLGIWDPVADLCRDK